MVSVKDNLVDLIWTDKPLPPQGKIFPLDIKFSGQDHHQKILKIREKMTEHGADGFVVTALDEIACK